MGLLNKTNKTDIISAGVVSYGWCGEFVDDKKRVKNWNSYSKWREDMQDFLGDETPIKEWLEKFDSVKLHLTDNTIVEYIPRDGYFSAHIFQRDGDLLEECIQVGCRTNPTLDEKTITDIIKSMAL